MINAYLAGKYSDPTIEGVCKNIENARRASRLLWSAGYAVLSPHMNTAHFDGVVEYTNFLDGDISWMRRGADVVVLIPGWESSHGTHREIEVARFCRIPVVTLEDALDVETIKRLIANR